ncbi:ABC transporter ATP-binding protein [Phytoactinopolyspora endophytica]|uniref:ABC transporter ATP-binding protein n=1 Tax=Phytoactinopolyspora endophytica TaxID=1642495 RepID=UPI00101D1B26|nr:ABC transporter ATP-binding protein [Phytoactinopolyspora endophytica]
MNAPVVAGIAAHDPPALVADGLSVRFQVGQGSVTAVDEISFGVRPGEVMALVGESGCGKSSVAMALAGLLAPNAELTGSVTFGDTDIVGLGERQLSKIRGRSIGVVFQEPMTSLNPVLTVGRQVSEVLRRHAGMSRKQAAEHSVELFERVGIPDPRTRARSYPHQLSGGMRQRVMIAMALACRPRVLIADEPTTALDVTVQSTILRLLRELGREDGTAIVLITHDLGVVADIADRVAIMYAGRFVEEGEVHDIFAQPSHPYTRALLAATPRQGEAGQGRLAEIPGIVPVLHEPATSCSFADRCTRVGSTCHESRPQRSRVGQHHVWCFHPVGEEGSR